jgi:multicomponent Na+:H+ antiporter subunit D
MLFDAGLRAQFYVPIAIALIFAVFTLFYMFRGWMLIFWGDRDAHPREYSHHKLSPLVVAPILLLAAIVLIVGLYPEPVVQLSQNIASQIIDPQPYIDAVMVRVIR